MGCGSGPAVVSSSSSVLPTRAAASTENPLPSSSPSPSSVCSPSSHAPWCSSSGLRSCSSCDGDPELPSCCSCASPPPPAAHVAALPAASPPCCLSPAANTLRCRAVCQSSCALDPSKPLSRPAPAATAPTPPTRPPSTPLPSERASRASGASSCSGARDPNGGREDSCRGRGKRASEPLLASLYPMRRRRPLPDTAPDEPLACCARSPSAP